MSLVLRVTRFAAVILQEVHPQDPFSAEVVQGKADS